MVVLYEVQPDSRSDIDTELPIRRTSARLKTVGAKKYTVSPSPTKKRKAPVSNKSGRVEKIRAINTDCLDECAGAENSAAGSDPSQKSDTGRVEKKQRIRKVQFKEDAEVVTHGSEAAVADSTAYTKVIETLRTFNKHYLHFIQEEENRCARQKSEEKKSVKKDSKSKKKDKSEDCAKKSSKRPDLKAITEMMNTGAILYTEKIIGAFPGIDVGHQFFSRAEMVVVGFHNHWLNGIDYIGKTASAGRKTSMNLTGYNLPLAISIVLSGQYEDDVDNCEDVVYTGQGGNDLLGNKRQISDQVLKRGNLGLKNCMEQSVPIRVVRGHKCENSYVKKVYTYDGLYTVVKYWAEKGVSGFTVYKFRLKRVEGQPSMTTKEVCFTRGRIPKSISEIRGMVCEDITRGLESIPIPVTNLVDDPPIMPPGFIYIKDMKISKNISVPEIAPSGCKCKGTCTDHTSCACAKLNGGDFPYVHREGGRLVAAKGVVFECGPNCGCGPKCVNRTSQSGPRFRLEIFRTPKKGWGVRSWDYIPSGSPICEYIGLLRKTDDLDPAADNSYVFDIDCLQTMKGMDGRERRLRDVSLPSYLQKVGEDATESVPFCIDAGKTGNFARFINHSCQPNLFVQCMLNEHHDISLARIMLIAADNIPPLKELTYDYGYALDSVMDAEGNVKQMACYCGAEECRKRLY
ncbi:hypothetical protein ABFS82_11G007700 [Erythranthe guttata]|nr:PREDICTED: histone-lysine N-methyltransferase, H3 lysine-9 specific SUVH4 [Erythranthe guttata]|eukprot:XP_012857425.1 PREDICTED: histone-lysine N-methyltransferase, H3 lysine-9 specific SUVH4 [Erythranthe guttata]